MMCRGPRRPIRRTRRLGGAGAGFDFRSLCKCSRYDRSGIRRHRSDSEGSQLLFGYRDSHPAQRALSSASSSGHGNSCRGMQQRERGKIAARKLLPLFDGAGAAGFRHVAGSFRVPFVYSRPDSDPCRHARCERFRIWRCRTGMVRELARVL